MKYASPILVALFLIYTTGLVAQQPKTSEVVIEKISDPLLHPMGYALDDKTGEWVALEGIVFDPAPNTTLHHNTQNMLWMRVARLKFQNRRYYMIFNQDKEELTDTIIKDQMNSIKNHFLILDSAEYMDFKRLLTLKNGITLTMVSQINTIMLGVPSTKTMEQKLADAISSKLDVPPNCFTARYVMKQGKDLVHFRIGDFCFSNDDVSSKKKIDTGYFEASYDDLLKVLID